MSSDYTKNLTSFSKIKRVLGQYLHKRHINHLETYLKKKKVKQFEREVLKALRSQMPRPSTIKRAVESLQKMTDAEVTRVRNVIDEDWGSFDSFISKTEITDYLKNVYTDSGNQALDNFGIDGVFDLQSQSVIDKLQDRTNYLIDSVDSTTIDDLAGRISRGVEEGYNWQDIAEQIKVDYMGEIAPYRAELISRMETGHAYNQAQSDFLTNNGFKTKIWVPDGDPCDICQENADAGSIDIDEAFPSGDTEPEAHVNCKCVLDTKDELPVDDAWTGQDENDWNDSSDYERPSIDEIQDMGGTYSDRQSKDVDFFQGVNYEVNGALRGNGSSAPADVVDRVTSRMDRITATHKMPENAVLYRGASNLKPGMVAKDNGYMFVTADKSWAAQYGDVVEVRIPKGTGFVNIGQVSAADPTSLALERGLTFRVITEGNKNIMEIQ